ncbi:MAG: ATP-binding protein [bacterium]
MVTSELERKFADFRETGFPPHVRRDGAIHMVNHSVSVLAGARRVGKSFYAMQAAEDLIASRVIPDMSHVCHVDFDNPVFASMTADVLPRIQSLFLKQNPSFTLRTPLVFVLDEIHRVSGWEDYVIDLSRNPSWRVIVTGSSARLLSKEIATSLRGKSITTKISPLTFREFLRFKKLDPDGKSTRQTATIRAAFDEYLRCGSFPAIPNTPDFSKAALLHEYYDTMLLRDIIQRHTIRAADDCVALYTYLLSCMAKPFTAKSAHTYLSHAGHKTGREAIASYIGFAEDAWMLQTVPLYTDSPSQALRNYRKTYAIDWALATCNSATWDGSFSRAFENMIHSELTRRFPRVRYALTRETRKEVDFLADDSQGQPALAAQVSLDISDPDTLVREVTPLLAVARYHHTPETLIITYADERVIRQDGVTIRVVPAWRWLLDT